RGRPSHNVARASPPALREARAPPLQGWSHPGNARIGALLATSGLSRRRHCYSVRLPDSAGGVSDSPPGLAHTRETHAGAFQATPLQLFVEHTFSAESERTFRKKKNPPRRRGGGFCCRSLHRSHAL